MPRSWPHYDDGSAIQQQAKQIPSPQMEGNIPLNNGEIERLCKRITEQDTNRDATHMLDQANNGARERKGLNLRDDIRAAQDGDHFEFANAKSRRRSRKLMTGHAIGSETE